MEKVKLEDIEFINTEEYFRMGGPYLGKIKIRDKISIKSFLVDNKVVSKSQSLICLSEFNGLRTVEKRVFVLFKRKVKLRDFRIILIDSKSGFAYRSKSLGEHLCIENITGNKITYHNAFHTGNNELKKYITFNEHNFKKFDFNKLFQK